MKSTKERVEAGGLSYQMTEPGQLWSLLLGGTVPVVAFTDEGVFFGYYGEDEAREVARRIRRKPGVDRVVLFTGFEEIDR